MKDPADVHTGDLLEAARQMGGLNAGLQRRQLHEQWKQEELERLKQEKHHGSAKQKPE